MKTTQKSLAFSEYPLFHPPPTATQNYEIAFFFLRRNEIFCPICSSPREREWEFNQHRAKTRNKSAANRQSAVLPFAGFLHSNATRVSLGRNFTMRAAKPSERESRFIPETNGRGRAAEKNQNKSSTAIIPYKLFCGSTF